MNRQRPDRAAIEAEIDRVRSLGLDALRKQWSSMFGSQPSARLTKDVIARMICHKIQENAFGGLDRDTIKLLNSLARDGKPEVLNRHLKPGTVLFREYNGERHTVTIAPNGYSWRGKIYPSLSKIAQTITGTPWNGPRFFGLRDRTRSQGTVKTERSSRKSTPAVFFWRRVGRRLNSYHFPRPQKHRRCETTGALKTWWRRTTKSHVATSLWALSSRTALNSTPELVQRWIHEGELRA
jgi:hypothetical protein